MDGTTPADVQSQVDTIKRQIGELSDALHELQKEFANDPANGGKMPDTTTDDSTKETKAALDAVEDEVVSASARRLQEYDANAKLRYDSAAEQANQLLTTAQKESQQITQNAINASNQLLQDAIARSEAMDNAVTVGFLKFVQNILGCPGEMPPKKPATPSGSVPTA